jgi:hypothetical protein
MFNVCTESHPTAFVYVCVGEELEVYVIPFQVYELHAVTLDEPVLLL